MNLDKTIVWAKKNIDEVQFKWIISGMDLKCRRCTRCCIIPAIPKVTKYKNEVCRYLTEEGLCSIYNDFSIRPYGCGQWPVLNSYQFMIAEELPKIRWQYNVCPIIKEFWERIYKFMENQNGNINNGT